MTDPVNKVDGDTVSCFYGLPVRWTPLLSSVPQVVDHTSQKDTQESGLAELRQKVVRNMGKVRSVGKRLPRRLILDGNVSQTVIALI